LKNKRLREMKDFLAILEIKTSQCEFPEDISSKLSDSLKGSGVVKSSLVAEIKGKHLSLTDTLEIVTASWAKIYILDGYFVILDQENTRRIGRINIFCSEDFLEEIESSPKQEFIKGLTTQFIHLDVYEAILLKSDYLNGIISKAEPLKSIEAGYDDLTSSEKKLVRSLTPTYVVCSHKFQRRVFIGELV